MLLTRAPGPMLLACAALLLLPAGPGSAGDIYSNDVYDVAVIGVCDDGSEHYLTDPGTGPGPCTGLVFDGLPHTCGTHVFTGAPIEIIETQTTNGATDVKIEVQTADQSDLLPSGLFCAPGFPIGLLRLVLGKEGAGGPGVEGDKLDPGLIPSPTEVLRGDGVVRTPTGAELLRVTTGDVGLFLAEIGKIFDVFGANTVPIGSIAFDYTLDGVPDSGGGMVPVLFPDMVTVPFAELQMFHSCLCPTDIMGAPDYGADGTPGTGDDACVPLEASFSTAGDIGTLSDATGTHTTLTADLPAGENAGAGQVVAAAPAQAPAVADVEVLRPGVGLTVIKTADRTRVGPDQDIVYTIVVTAGTEPEPFAGVTLKDFLPPIEATYVSIDPSFSWICLLDDELVEGELIPDIASGWLRPHVDCVYQDDLEPFESTTPIQITIRSGQLPTTLINRVTAESVTGGFDTDTEEVEVTTANDLTLTKEGPPDPAPSDQPIRYTIVVTNTGPNVAGSFQVIDTLPESYQLLGQEGGVVWSCNSPVGQTVTCTHTGPLGPGESSDPLILVVQAPDAPPGVSTNTAQVTDTDPDDDNDTAEALVTVIPVADIFTVKIAEPTSVRVDTQNPLDRRVTYTLRVHNIGPATAYDVVVTDTLPADVTFVSGPSECNHVNRVVTCQLGDIPPPPANNVAEVDIIVEVIADAFGQICNQATATTTSEDRFPSNDTSAPACISGDPTIELSLTKSRITSATQVGVPIFYRVTVQNLSMGPADQVVVTDLLPSNVANVDGTPDQGICDVQPGLDRILCDIGTMASGQAVDVIVQLTPLVPGQLCNTASVDADALPPGGDVPQVCDDIEVGPDVAIFKTFIPNPSDPVLQQEIAFEIELTATNGGNAPVVNVQISDALPAGVSFIAFTAGSTGCSYDPATRVVSCGPGSPWATLGPGESRSVRFAARYSGRGELCNIAQVSTTTTQPTANDSTETCEDFAPTVDLRLVKSGPPRFVGIGQRLVYTLEATNPGPGNASSVQIADLVPAGMSLVSASYSRSGGPPQQCGEQAGDAVCNVGPMPVGDLVTVTVEVDTVAPGEACDRGDIAASPETERNVEDNSPEYCNEVIVGLADLQVVKFGPGIIPVLGQPFDFTIEVTNLGPDTATGVVLDDVLAFELGFDGASFVRDGDPPGTPPTACPQDPATRNVRCVIGALASTEVATVTISVVPQFADVEFCNTASADLTGEFDPDPGNNVSPRVGESPLCLTATNDRDADGVADDVDNCADFPNPGQGDSDGNGIGDACECGDQNGDGTVDVLDILALNRVIFGLEPAGPLAAATGDGSVNVADILAVNAKIFGAPAFCPPRTAPPPGGP